MTPLSIATMNNVAEQTIDLLWRSGWQGALFIAAIWIFCRLAPALPATYRCWLWRLACLKMVLGLAAIPWTAITVPDRVARPIAPVAALMDAGSGNVAHLSKDFMPQIYQVAAATGAQDLSWQAALCAVWLTGIVVLLCLGALQVWSLKRMLAASERVSSQEWKLALTDAAGDLSPHRMPRLVSSADTLAPFVTGLRSPVIVIPDAHLETFSSARQRLSLLHEIAHVRRRDLWWSLLVTAIAMLFFFHPLVWLARREEEAAREEACDAFVLNAGVSAPAEYGALLLELASGRRLQWSGALGMNGNFRTLQRRLQSMKRFSTNPKWGLKVTAGIIAAAVVIAMPWTLRSQASAEQTDIAGAWVMPFNADIGKHPYVTLTFRRDGSLHAVGTDGGSADGFYSIAPGHLTYHFTHTVKSPLLIVDFKPHQVRCKLANNTMILLKEVAPGGESRKDADEPQGVLRRRKDADGRPVDRKSDETIIWAPAILPNHALQIKSAMVPGYVVQDGYIMRDEHNTVRYVFKLPQGTIVQGTALLQDDEGEGIMAQMPGIADPIPVIGLKNGLVNATKIGFRVTSPTAVTFQ